MSREQEELLGVLGRKPSGLADRDTDWDRVLELAPLPLRPVLAHWLRDAGTELRGHLSEKVRCELAQAERANVMAYLQRRVVVEQALSALGAQDVPVVLLKGIALAHSVYPHPATRAMSDLDLWVPDESLDRAAKALVEAGLRFPSRVLPEGKQLPWLSVRQLEAPDSRVMVELHGQVRSLELLPPERVRACWEQAVPLEIEGRQTLMLRPEDMLLHVCLHVASSHRFAVGPLPLVDVLLIVKRWGDTFDWTAMARDYAQHGVGTWMYLTLALVRDLLGANVPDAFFAELPEPSRLTEMNSLAREQLWTSNRTRFGGLERVLRHGTVADRARALYRRLVYHHWEPERGMHRSAATAVRDAGGRLWTDITVKLPRYVRAWRRGDLRGDELTACAALARRRGRLGELVDAAEEHGKERSA